MSSPALAYQEKAGGLPARYTLPGDMAVRLSSVAATFDGSGAASDFLACLSAYSQDGKLIGRWFPPQPIPAGDTAVVSFGGDAGVAPSRNPYNTYHVVSAASNNAAAIKTTAGVVHGWYCFNNSGAPLYVKLYNKASSPSPAADTPKLTIALPPGAAANLAIDDGISFATGIGIAIVAGIQDNDNTAVAADDAVATIYYL